MILDNEQILTIGYTQEGTQLRLGRKRDVIRKRGAEVRNEQRYLYGVRHPIKIVYCKTTMDRAKGAPKQGFCRSWFWISNSVNMLQPRKLYNVFFCFSDDVQNSIKASQSIFVEICCNIVTTHNQQLSPLVLSNSTLMTFNGGTLKT